MLAGALLAGGCKPNGGSSGSAAASASAVAATATSGPAIPARASAAPVEVSSAIDYCKACGAPLSRGSVTSAEIKEGSGIVASAVHADVFYVHNDSGDRARFFAVSAAGGDLGSFEVQGVEAHDWEDIARGPCEGGSGSCIYLADIGDNAEKRTDCAIYRVVEPAEVGPGQKSVHADRIPIEYPDGGHNAETLLVHPDTGVVTIVTKVPFGASQVFELPMPLTVDERMVAKQVGSIAPTEGSPRYTGGDVHPRGAGVLLRTYTSLFFFPMRQGQSVASALAGSACVVPDAEEEQGEAVAWLRNGAGYVTLSEGVGQKLNQVECGGR